MGTQKGVWIALAALLCSNTVWAAGPPQPSSMSNPVVITLVIVMLVLLLAIALLANVLLGVARFQQETEQLQQSSNKTGVTATAIATLMLLSLHGVAQTGTVADTAAAAATANNFGSLSPTAFYFMAAVILLEVIVIITLLAQLKGMIARERERRVAEAVASGVAAVSKKPKTSWWNRFNRFRPEEQEAELDLGHDYDGIRELDNRLPPWWLWGFYLTIAFAIVYLWRYHVSHAAPLSAEEYAISVQKAEERQREYLKTAANLVDENTVKLLTSATDISAGKNIFEQNCTPCHGKAGEGNQVGPNLTDDYWIHGGRINEVFKTIKYGWQEKGMRSWKDDFTPSQIAQIASFVKSLKGSNPPNPKPPQGELFRDSTASPATADSLSTAGKTTSN